MKFRRQRLAHEFTWIQGLAAFRSVREQNLGKENLAVERGASLGFRAEDLDRCKVRPANDMGSKVRNNEPQGTNKMARKSARRDFGRHLAIRQPNSTTAAPITAAMTDVTIPPRSVSSRAM